MSKEPTFCDLRPHEFAPVLAGETVKAARIRFLLDGLELCTAGSNPYDDGVGGWLWLLHDPKRIKPAAP